MATDALAKALESFKAYQEAIRADAHAQAATRAQRGPTMPVTTTKPKDGYQK